MSDFAALEILASINRLASEIKSINPPVEVPWYKTYIALISGVTGITLAFIYNSCKEHFGNKKKIKKYKRCIDNEVERLKKHSKMRVEFTLNTLDRMISNPNVIPWVGSIGFLSTCFDNFYHEVVHILDDKQNNYLCFTYTYLKDAEKHSAAIEEIARKGEINGIYNLLEVMLTSYCGAYLTAEIYFGAEEVNTFSNIEIAKKMGFSGRYINLHDKSRVSNNIKP